jgi:hypothetical protein
MAELIKIENFKSSEELWEAGRKIVAAAPVMFVEVDIEADGIAGHGSMLSIGAQSITGQSFYSEIKPVMEDYIPDQKVFCEQIGLERVRLLKEAPEANVVMNRFMDWLDGEKKATGKQPVFSAFNAGFDWAFFDLYRFKAGFDPSPFGIAPFDLKSLAMAIVPGWDWTKTSTSKLPAVIKPVTPYAHHALLDAKYQQQIHFGLAAILDRKTYQGVLSELDLIQKSG